MKKQGSRYGSPLRDVCRAKRVQEKHEKSAADVAYSPASAAGRLSGVYGTILPAYRSHLAGPDMRRQDKGRDALQTERPVRQWPVLPAWRIVYRAKDRGRQAAFRSQRKPAQTEAQNRRRKANPMRGQEILRSATGSIGRKKVIRRKQKKKEEDARTALSFLL